MRYIIYPLPTSTTGSWGVQMQLVQGGSQTMTPQKRSTRGRKVYVVSDCKKTLEAASNYVRSVSEKRGLSMITREGFADSLHDFTPGDFGIISIANVRHVTNELKATLKMLNEDTYRNIHVVIPASANRETPVVSYIMNYFPNFTGKRIWQGMAKLHHEITRLIPA